MLVLNVEVKAISPIRLKSSLSKVQILPKITGNIFHLHVHKSRLFEILDGLPWDNFELMKRNISVIVFERLI